MVERNFTVHPGWICDQSNALAFKQIKILLAASTSMPVFTWAEEGGKTRDDHWQK